MKKIIKTEYWNGDKEKKTYEEYDDGSWIKRIYNEHGVPVFIIDSEGDWQANILDGAGTGVEGLERKDGLFSRNTIDNNGNAVFYHGNHFTHYEKWIIDQNGHINPEFVSTTKRLSEDELSLFMQLPNITNDFDRAIAFKRELYKVCPGVDEKLSAVELDTFIECCYKATLRELSNGYPLGSLISYPSEEWMRLFSPPHIKTTSNEELEVKDSQAEKTAQEANKEAWLHYHIALEIYDGLPWWKKRRRNKPEPPREKEKNNE